MRMGSKKIYHLEAWVVKVMCLYKVSLRSTSRGTRLTDEHSSTLHITLTCPSLIELVGVEVVARKRWVLIQCIR